MPARPIDFLLHLSKAQLGKYGNQSRLTGFVKKWKWPEKLEIVQIAQYKPVSVVHIVQCYPDGSGGFTRRELCRDIGTQGRKEKARSGQATGFSFAIQFTVVNHIYHSGPI